MMAHELIGRAHALCRALGRPFPAELKGYAMDWQRQRYDLAWCWNAAKNAPKGQRALWPVDVDVRRHHDHLQRLKDAKDRKAGEPLQPTPAAGPEPWWESPEEYTWSPEEDVPSPASVGSPPDEPDDVRPSAEPRQTLRAPRQPEPSHTVASLEHHMSPPAPATPAEAKVVWDRSGEASDRRGASGAYR